MTPSGQTIKNGTIKADTAHDGAKHTVTTQGGVFCWDCHDPHGDRPSNTNSSGYNIEMIRSQIFVKQDGTYGYLGSAGVPRAVEYYSRSAPAVPSPAGNIEETTTAAGTAHKGICQACHDPTNPAPNPATAWTKYWGYTGYDDPDGSTGAAPYASGAATAPTHNPTGYCITCHKHSGKFAGSGGGPDCRGCHGTGTQGSRRAVNADFALKSHHVGNASATMGGTLSNADCAVCHAEAAVSGGVITGTDATYHANGKIDLRNVDSTTAVFTYDKDAVAAAAGAATNWGSKNATWRTQTSANLDPFCIGCHDSDGASQIANFRADAAATALNPFNDAKITNEVDQIPRCDGAPATQGGKPTCGGANPNGRIVDIKSMVSGAPPAQGIYSRHAIRGQSTSRYSLNNIAGCVIGSKAPIGTNCSMYETGAFVSTGQTENGDPLWSDKSVMGCADCHTADGANGAAGNAHGSGSEYMLKDASGGATIGTLAGVSYVCYRCHNSASLLKYTSTPHTGSGSDWIDHVGASYIGATNRAASMGNWAGYACGNCHGTTKFGGIHGTSETLPVGVGGTGAAGGTLPTPTPNPRPAYRFSNGASLRYQDAMGWSGTQGGCYTLAGSGSGEAGWGTCNKHDGTARTKALIRPRDY